MDTRKLQWQNPITNNKKLNRFETEISGEFAYVDYRFLKTTLLSCTLSFPIWQEAKGSRQQWQSLH